MLNTGSKTTLETTQKRWKSFKPNILKSLKINRTRSYPFWFSQGFCVFRDSFTRFFRGFLSAVFTMPCGLRWPWGCPNGVDSVKREYYYYLRRNRKSGGSGRRRRRTRLRVAAVATHWRGGPQGTIHGALSISEEKAWTHRPRHRSMRRRNSRSKFVC